MNTPPLSTTPAALERSAAKAKATAASLAAIFQDPHAYAYKKWLAAKTPAQRRDWRAVVDLLPVAAEVK